MKKLCCFILVSCFIIGKDFDEDAVKIGNFALPASQQIAPLFSFGQTLIGKKKLQGYIALEYFKSTRQSFFDVVPYMLYGVTDSCAIMLGLPIAARYRSDNHRTSNVADLFMQVEYALSSKSSATKSSQATIVGYFTLPTGSPDSKPPTGAGVPTLFLGLTANYLAEKWYLFTSYGGVFPIGGQGAQLIYQAGIGRNICNPKGWILDWLVELTGSFADSDSMRSLSVGRRIYRNTGGNVVYLAPSLWLSTERCIIQAGIAGVIAQSMSDPSMQNRYCAILNVGWTFA